MVADVADAEGNNLEEVANRVDDAENRVDVAVHNVKVENSTKNSGDRRMLVEVVDRANVANDVYVEVVSGDAWADVRDVIVMDGIRDDEHGHQHHCFQLLLENMTFCNVLMLEEYTLEEADGAVRIEYLLLHEPDVEAELPEV